jgi:hypothetical protein
MKKVLTGIGVIAFAVALTGVTMAAEQTATQTKNKVKSQVNTQAQVLNKERLQLMERAGGLDEKTVETMVKQHYGDGEIVIAGALSKASNQPLSQILSLKKQGMGWGEIAQKYNLKLGNVMKSVHANINAFENHAKLTGDKAAITASNNIRNEIQNQERLNMKEMMENRNQQMQHEMNMNEQQGQGMRMNEQQPNMNMHK